MNAASLTITGPASGLPVIFISATQGSDPPAYQKGTGTQIDTTEAATYDITFDGSFALYGLLVKSGRSIIIGSDDDEHSSNINCTFAPGPTGTINFSGSLGGREYCQNLIVDLSQDGTTQRSTTVFTPTSVSAHVINGVTFINAGYRTGTIFGNGQQGFWNISNADLSGFTDATPCEIFDTIGPHTTITNCKTAATFTMVSGTPSRPYLSILATNVGSADDPTSLRYHTYFGTIASSTTIYRSSGATIEGIANSWLVTTTANCNEYAPFHSPWIYGLVSSTGSKVFDVYITNDTADFTNAQVWLEVEYLATSDSPLWTLASDQRATITTTAADQDDDTTSTWVGAGPAYTYKQRLRVTATVNETGQFRARVVTGVASIASSRYFHIDPLVTVT